MSRSSQGWAILLRRSWLLCGLFLALLVGCQPTAVPTLQVLSGETMGTTYSIKLVPNKSASSLADIADRVTAELALVNDQMSTYIATSELSRFNDQQSSDWFVVSSETAAVVALALEIHAQTDGAFDVTVGPLVDLWGFGPQRRPEQVPTDADVARTLKFVGSDKLEARLDPPALRKSVGGLRVDLSAIAKGHGVDRVAGVLESLGVAAYFVEIGGEVRTRGRRLDGAAWRVGIEKPAEGERVVQSAVGLYDQALATSGNYRNFYEQDGRRINHFIDPRSGFPVENDLVSVSVVADNCALADALATGLMASGYDKGLNIAKTHNLTAMMIAKKNGGLEVMATAQFEKLMLPSPTVEGGKP